MLQVRFRQPEIPRTAQVKGGHPLRNSRFNPGPEGMGLLEGFGALPLPCCLESGMLRLWSDGQCSSQVFVCGMHAIGETRTRAAISDGKLDFDQVRMVLSAERGPTAAGFALRASCLLVLPIKEKLTRINAGCALGLPLGVNGHGANHKGPKALLTLNQDPSAHIACINEMLSWWQIGLGQLLLNDFRHRLISSGCRSGGHVCDQVVQRL